MTKLKVTEVQSEEEEKEDVVEAGQVRTDELGHVVLIINGDSHFEISKDVAGSFEDKFLAVFLESAGMVTAFDVNENKGLSSAKDIADEFPILLDAELTYKEAK